MAPMLLLFCVNWFVAALSAAPAPAPYALEDAELHFERFIQKYERSYTDENEKQARFLIFKKSLENINSLNEKSKHAVFGITEFSDLSHEEFKSKITCLRSSDESNSIENSNTCKYFYDKDIDCDYAPESFDWSALDAVTPVKDQQGCGSCHAFTAIGSIEGQYAIKLKQLDRVSEQQIVDCDEKDFGCAGGYMDVALRSLIEHGGYESESDECSLYASKEMTDCSSYNLTSQEILKELLYHIGPIRIEGIQATGLYLYSNGFFLCKISDENCNVNDVNHTTLLVGYGSENGVPFWIVKNSWHPETPDHIRTQRGEGAISCAMMIKA